jgi:hypothetical protein
MWSFALASSNPYQFGTIPWSRLRKPKVLTAIRVIAERYAREEVKRQIRASGVKLSQYPARDIARLAHALPEERWKEFIAKAKASSVLQEVRLECERREQRKAQCRTVQILHQAGLSKFYINL